MACSNRRLLVTGANGFIGKNLLVRLEELSGVSVNKFVRGDDLGLLREHLAHCDAVIHLAGENRPASDDAFEEVNGRLTTSICKAIEEEFNATGRSIVLVLASSIQAGNDTPYGRSKLVAEVAVRRLAKRTGIPCVIFRLPGVFGKWCRPNYNSVVATFCHNIARNLPITLDDPQVELRLAYIDDVVNSLIQSLDSSVMGCVEASVGQEYRISLGELADQIKSFSAIRSTLTMERVGSGLTRALYATFISYLPQECFSYEVPQHSDRRGIFVEMLKTPDCGQFSFFTAGIGVTRGGHYHHTKTEKFLVVKGEALFRFRHLLTDELVELRTNGDKPRIVDTIPGWTHDITNVGKEEMAVMLWANENFDPHAPDTIASKI